jgi:EAL domain-containing protein (putative c-di-GMP-specific phosphodiesterase class I)
MGDDELRRILADELITPVYQPIVDLYDGNVVGYEALARGPRGPLERPDLLFGAARAANRLTELDELCRRMAVRGAATAGLRAPSTLFINVEAEALVGSGAVDTEDLDRVPDGIRLVVEITERALTARPADLLPAVEKIRARGFGIALDDIGADPHSLAIMPFLRPDVIKLDLRLIQSLPSAEIAQIHNAVSAQAERTGAAIVAEGIETSRHADRARAMGATLGQGFGLGRPGALPARIPLPAGLVPIHGPVHTGEQTPFEAVSRQRPVRRSTKRLLLEVSRELERQATTLGGNAVVISTFQHQDHFTPATSRVYEDLAGSIAFVGALGEDMGVDPAPGVRGAELCPDDPLCEEWDIVVVGPHFAAAFAARDVGDRGPDMERRFDLALTHDRDLSVRAARALMSRIAPVGSAAGVHQQLAV